MCDSKECLALLNKHLPYLQKEFGVRGLCLFGSFARGDNGPDSDVDLLVDMPPKIILLSALKDFLERLLNTSVDIVRYHSHLSQKFLNQINNDGIRLL
ncbi:MAG: nucleotidyltransferase domain-containing protein [Muribaculaceae bacterium]|nr:nucleotidyltransferase domain-containing protein [Muribaculaceae bacterium]